MTWPSRRVSSVGWRRTTSTRWRLESASASSARTCPPLYGLEYNPGNWRSGHVSIPPHVVLFVTLKKSDAMAWGADYVDHFEGDSTFVWSSQTSTGPDGKKGREIIGALERGTFIHLWVRRRKTDVAFAYLGLVVPVSHEGAKPMSVRFRLLTPAAGVSAVGSGCLRALPSYTSRNAWMSSATVSGWSSRNR